MRKLTLWGYNYNKYLYSTVFWSKEFISDNNVEK